MPDVVESFNCANCGAPLKIREGEAVAVCDYCGSLNSLRADKTYIIRHAWMPNKLKKEEAIAKAGEWLSGGMLMPSGLGPKSVTKAELSYIPLWVFEAKAKAAYSGASEKEGGKPAKGALEKNFFWKVLGRRQSSFPAREYKVPLTYKVPFSIEDMMHGEMLNSELDEGEAREIARQEVEAHVKSLLSSDVDRFDSIDIKVEFGEPELVHVPAWFMEFEYKGKSYKIVLEGTEGSVLKGEIPGSDFLGGEMKLIMAVAAALILVGACALLSLGFLR